MVWRSAARTTMPIALLGVALLSGSSLGLAQSISNIMPQSFDLGNASDGPGGLALYGVTGFIGYADFQSPIAATTDANGALSGQTIFGGGSVTGGWRKKWARSQASIAYSLSYSKAPQLFSSNGLGHAVQLNWSTSLSKKWQLAVSGQSSIANLQDSLFQPEVLTIVQSPAASFQDLSTAAAAGQFTSSQIASMLTGAPILESPARTLLFGERMLTTSLQNSLTYSRSSRLSVSFSLGANRAQHWGRADDQPDGAYQMPANTSAQAGVGVNYSFSPRTQVGVNTSYGRTYSHFENAATNSTTLTVGHNTGQHWSFSGFGGYGFIQPITYVQVVSEGGQYLAGGSVRYRTRYHQWVASYNHSISTVYAYGVQANHGIGAGWSWERPIQRWSTSAQWSYQNGAQPNVAIGYVTGWSVQTRIGYRVSDNVSASAQWAYLKDSSSFTSNLPNYLNGSTYRLSVTWHPVSERRHL